MKWQYLKYLATFSKEEDGHKRLFKLELLLLGQQIPLELRAHYVTIARLAYQITVSSLYLLLTDYRNNLEEGDVPMALEDSNGSGRLVHTNSSSSPGPLLVHYLAATVTVADFQAQ